MTVIPEDGGCDGQRARSTPAKVINSPPVILNKKEITGLDGFQLKVADEDNDELKYEMHGAPTMMYIDSDGTLLRVVKPGTYKVTLTVSDAYGGADSVDFSYVLNTPTDTDNKGRGKRRRGHRRR